LRAEPTLAPPLEQIVVEPDLTSLRAAAQAEKRLQCDAPRNSGWRPGARWARQASAAPKGQTRRDVEMQIAALPPHKRPPMRMLGRTSEASHHPYRRLASDDGASPPWTRRGSNDPHAAPPDFVPYLGSDRAGLDQTAKVAGVVLITTHKVGSRIEVAAASPAAGALGISRGMALTQVRALVPEVIVRDADPEGDAADLHKLAVLLARRWTPTVARSDADGLFLDLTGITHLHGGEQRMAARLVRLLGRWGFAARIAIADTTGAAWALARHSGRVITLCPPGGHEQALGALPAAALRLPEATLPLLRRLGVETVGEVAALPRAPFARRFGMDAARRLDQALGDAAEPLDPVVPPQAIHVVRHFAEPIATADAIEYWLSDLVPRLTLALTQSGQGARTLLFVADRVDGRPQTIRIGFARANRDPAHMLRLILRRIEEIEPGYGIDALHLHVRRAEPLGAQPFDEALEGSEPDLATLVDMLANRAVPAWRDLPVESDVPERSVARRAPLDAPPRAAAAWKRDDVRRLDDRAHDHPWHPSRPRPARLLRRPERLDHVVAALPDQPPRRFTWRGRRHVVTRADGPERIAGEWWRRSAERDAVRDYFRVEVETGQRFWLFRRGDGERGETGDLSWYLHGQFG